MKPIRFDDVGKILVGKRPFAPRPAEESRWDITTPQRGFRVLLNSRRIVMAPAEFNAFVGRSFEELTRWLVDNDKGIDLKLL